LSLSIPDKLGVADARSAMEKTNPPTLAKLHSTVTSRTPTTSKDLVTTMLASFSGRFGLGSAANYHWHFSRAKYL
jgi:hypothetical protein